MTEKFDPHKHHRRSIRLKGYDYTQPGAYFVTLCTRQRERLFGEVIDGQMRLNELGVIVRDEWSRTEMVRPNVRLGAFTVMPNHIHGIIIIVGASRWVAPTAGLRAGSLGAILGQFKSITAKRINTLRQTPGVPVWQRNYYERIIRDDNEWRGIHDYILNNPAQWETDQENLARY